MGDIIDFREKKKQREAPREYNALVKAQIELFGEEEPSFLDTILMQEEIVIPETSSPIERFMGVVRGIYDESQILSSTRYMDFSAHDQEAYKSFLEKAGVYFIRNRHTEGVKTSLRAFHTIRAVFVALTEVRLSGSKIKRAKLSAKEAEDFDSRVFDQALKQYHQ